MRLVNGLVAGAFLLLAVSVLAHLQSASLGTTVVLGAIGLSVGIGAALALPADPDRQDRVGFLATIVLLFAILLWSIQSVFAPLFDLLIPAPAAAALAPIVPTLLVLALARRLVDFDATTIRLRRPTGGAPVRRPLAALGIVLVIATTALAASLHPLGSGIGWIAIAVAFEEILYRGFLLAVVRERAGWQLAIAVSAVVYALAGGLGGGGAGAVLSARLGVGIAAGLGVVWSERLVLVWAARIAGIGLARAIWG